MARTKQTIRKSTGGKAPRRRLAAPALQAQPAGGPAVPDLAELLGCQPRSNQSTASTPTGLVTRYAAEPIVGNNKPDGDSGSDSESDRGSDSGSDEDVTVPANVETLLFTIDGSVYRPRGVTQRGRFQIGEAIGKVSYGGEDDDVEAFSPVYDSYSGGVYLRVGHSVVRMGADLRLTTVAGTRDQEGDRDGSGDEARFEVSASNAMVTDGDGRLYVADGDCIRCVTLPRIAAGRKRLVTGEAAEPAGEAQVSTLRFKAAAPITGLAYIPASPATGGGGLAFSTATAVYWLPLPRGNSAAPGASTPEAAADAAAPAAAKAGGDTGARAAAGPSSTSAMQPVSLAGMEGQELGDAGPGAERQLEPRPGPEARFRAISGLTVDGSGSLLLLCSTGHHRSWVRRVSVPDGTTTTLATNLVGGYTCPSVLPNGFFAACDEMFSDVCVIDLALTPPPCCPPGWSGLATRAAAASTQLCADLGALLDRQPDGTADLSLVVGGRTFHAHRSILTARSKYFSSRLAGDFVEGRARVLDLPDADPDALALVLKWVYTGAVDVPPGKVQAVVELADRLELLQLGEELQKRVLAGVDAETVVDALLWADARQFQVLRERLLSWFLGHQGAVIEAAPDSVKRLMVANPGLMLEVQEAMCKQRNGR
ncbi:hypothetical protein HYH03_010770 [Edaphochlamys debaryana]|uniref:BTB domain-containing protein n=1 Tax=Edaphochlamys debaryana TaxID=47281 RepID=A0A835XWF2_9CHLO|nr:hypothetical protein HYH03_010770 [Edaphochlamys debaryana]|eukprot:KAG2490852.1 hypothetical protein HYH03_010770 [Edaphochlamys debaryana]